jgi:heterodisulfide reductase subunit A
MGADNAGVSHFEYPANTRNILVMCAGRVDRDFVMEAFRLGAGAVVVSGCHPQDCHYIDGRQHADERMSRLATQLEKLGITPGRFRVESISATEGAKWARVMRETNETIQELTVETIMAENDEARPKLTRFVRRMRDVPGVSTVLELSEEARLQGIRQPSKQPAPVAGGE